MNAKESNLKFLVQLQNDEVV